MTETNLSQYYRQPEIYITLPNKGRFYPAGVLENTATGEIPVFALSARDDIALKTPDSLISGEAIVQVINNCIPNITDAWKMPIAEVDYLLIAIRIASYGENMPLSSKCPACGEEGNYGVNLNFYIDKLLANAVPAEAIELDYKGLKIILKPMDYMSWSILQRKSFEEQKQLSLVNDEDAGLTDEEKTERYRLILKEMTDLNFEMVSHCIQSITTPEGDVIEDADTIVNFVDNSSVGLFKEIQKRIERIKESSDLADVDIKCENEDCENEYSVPLIFDYSTFFA
jgi:hypothetical protein